MNKFFRTLPLQAKLMLIGIIPFFFLLYLTIQVYDEKSEKLALFEDYKQYIDEAEDISQLINSMQDERKYSFDYVLTGNSKAELLLQRPRTNYFLGKLKKTDDLALSGFIGYTKLKYLDSIRTQVDNKKIGANGVMHFYSNTVFRLNTLNSIPPANTPYLKPVFKELMTHKILSEMITYLGIIRSNIYNVLQTKMYVVETLMGTYGTHEIYNSYEEELLAKASKQTLSDYNSIKKNTALGPTVNHIDLVFKTFSVGDTFTAAEWWKVSDHGANELRKLQSDTWKSLDKKIEEIYQTEKQERKETLMLLILALGAVAISVIYILYLLSRTLTKLRVSAEKIANGQTDVDIVVESNDALGSLAESIHKIDRNNQALALAAEAIGKGNFEIDLKPRSENDALAIALSSMKQELRQYRDKMEELVAFRTEQLARSNEDLQQFAHVASHDLKEPLRKIATFSDILINDPNSNLSEKGRLYLDKIENASKRMSVMIEGVLAYSTISSNGQKLESLELSSIIRDVENDLELAILQKDAQIVYSALPKIEGVRILIHQLFYNLIGNSLKFINAGVNPVISISSEKIEKIINKHAVDCFLITLTDNGIGFNQEHAEKIFGVFSRLHSKEQFEGTGLGLALCRKIVKRHGGEMSAEGEEGKGATFRIYLPIKNTNLK